MNGTHLLQLFGKNICITPVQVFKLDFVHGVTWEECLGQVMVVPLEPGEEGFFIPSYLLNCSLPHSEQWVGLPPFVTGSIHALQF